MAVLGLAALQPRDCFLRGPVSVRESVGGEGLISNGGVGGGFRENDICAETKGYEETEHSSHRVGGRRPEWAVPVGKRLGGWSGAGGSGLA